MRSSWWVPALLFVLALLLPGVGVVRRALSGDGERDLSAAPEPRTEVHATPVEEERLVPASPVIYEGPTQVLAGETFEFTLELVDGGYDLGMVSVTEDELVFPCAPGDSILCYFAFPEGQTFVGQVRALPDTAGRQASVIVELYAGQRPPSQHPFRRNVPGSEEEPSLQLTFPIEIR